MRPLVKFGTALAVLTACALSACGGELSSSDSTSARTKNAVLAEADPELVADNVDAVATKQIVTTTAVPNSTTVVEAVAATSAVTTTAPPADVSATVSPASTSAPASDEVESSSDSTIASSDKTLPITDESIATDVLTNKSAEMSVNDDAEGSSNIVVYIVLLALILGAGGFAYRRLKS